MAERLREHGVELAHEAIDQARRRGISADELSRRIDWFQNHLAWFPEEHRGGALYVGIVRATPGMAPDEAWPYQADRVRRERQAARQDVRDFEREIEQRRRRARVAAQQAHSQQHAAAIRARWQPVLGAMTPAELAELEREAFPAVAEAWLDHARPMAMFRDCLLAQLNRRSEAAMESERGDG